ncbi:MAG: DUF3373 family protein [Sulfurovum sp.]|uniref:DUF3373 family protein n=1 Tax=Sulfurovum sp. TaxID=1969726 RepID=UPI003C75B16B
MKKIITASVVAALALTSVQAQSTSQRLADIEAELAKVQKKLKKQNKKINEVKAHDSGDNLKWGADMRTAYDNISYDMANGDTRENNSLYSMRLWLNMAYAPDENNVFKGQLSMNKAFGADFASPTNRTFSLGGQFDWTSNEALTDNSLKVRQAYWLYLGEEAFGADMPWTFSIGRRPSTGGFLASLSQDDAPNSPLGHMINVEYDGLSSKLDLSKVTGIPGMSVKLCMGKGSTNAQPLFETPTPYADGDFSGVDEVTLAGVIIEPYNDGQIITKAMLYRAWDVPGQNAPTPDFSSTVDPMNPSVALAVDNQFYNFGNMDGAVFSVMVDGLTEDGYWADAKVFGSFGWSESDPDGGSMLGSPDSESGTSYWFGAYLPVTDGENNYGTVGLEYNHGSEYWRPFTYAEDTMIGSKLAARGDAWEANYTYQINDALSMQLRYVSIDYEYTGSNGFFGNYSGGTNKISDMKNGAAMFEQLGGSVDENGVAQNLGVVTGALMAQGLPMDQAQAAAGEMAGAAIFLPNVVEAAEDFRFYIRYRF